MNTHGHDDWTPEERQQLEQELLELHFGCHENPEAIEARLDKEPALRRLQANVLSHAEVLEEAVRPEQPRLQLPNQVQPVREPRFWHTVIGRLGAAAAAAAIALLGFFAYERVAAYRAADYRERHLHLTVSAPKAVPSGAPWSFTVQAEDLTGTAAACKVRWRALDDSGAALAADETAIENGSATVSLPAALQVPARVEVVAASAHDEVRQVFELSTAAAGPLVHVSTDRPVYRPGEPVFVRAVVLDRVTRLPLPRQLQMSAQLFDAKDAPVGNDYEQATPGGVGSFRLQVPPQGAGGAYKVKIASGDGSFATETADIVVRDFRAPQLDKTIVLDRKSYAPGARGSAKVRAVRLSNQSAASGALARAALIVDGEEVWHEERGLDADGAATFRFEVPKDVDKGAARLVARIEDSGIVETEVEPFVVPTGRVLVTAFPEGGDLVAGVENSIYFECSDPLGRPIDTAGELVDARDRRVASFRTSHQGRGKLRFVPSANQRYRLRLAGKAETFDLPDVQQSGIALRLLDDTVAAGQPLRLAAAGRGEGPWLIGVFCRGVLVGQTTLRADAGGELRQTAEVDLPASASGVLRATVFDRTLQPIAERLLQRQAQQRLDVAITPAKDVLAPGDKQTIKVRTTDENGSARRAVVGVRCTDKAATSLGSEPRVGLADHAQLFADVERTEDLGDFFLGHAGCERNVDLLLGTRGWRRFVWRNDADAQAAIAARGDAANGILTREGFSQTPQVKSNLKAARAPSLPLARAAHDARDTVRTAAAIALIALLLLALTEGFAALLRRTKPKSPVMTGLSGFAMAAGLLLLGLATITNTIGGQRDAMPAATAMPLEQYEGKAPTWDFDDSATDALVQNFAPATTESRVLFGALARPIDLNGFGNDWTRFDPFLGVSAFFDGGLDGSVRARTENFFSGKPGPDLRLKIPDDDLPLFPEVATNGLLLNPNYATLSLDASLYDLPFELGAGDWDDPVLEGNASGGARDVRLFYERYAQSWRQRQYAHQHTPGEDRRDFTSTVYWHTLLVTDGLGEASATFATSDAVTTWHVEADAHVAKGDTGRVGQGEATFTTQLPLQVEPKLPVEVSAGDRLEVPVSCSVEDDKVAEVTLQVRVGEGLRLAADAPKKVALTRDNAGVGRGRALLVIDVDNTVGIAPIEISARGGRFVDKVRHVMRIAPRGFPHSRSHGGTITAAEPGEWQLAIPAESVEGSGRVTLKVYPSPVAALTEGLEGILREPHGCFEQASSSNYPNTLVLNLIEASGDDIPEVAARARQLLPRGYAKITGYECSRKGYEWFGHDPGHEALTAYGLLQFDDMANVYDVDMGMVDRTKTWLLGRRDGKGNYPHDGTDHHSFGGRSLPVTNAYVTYALLQAGTPADELATELDAMVARISTADPYELALIACALHLTDRTEVELARGRLADMQADDGSLPGAKSTITMSGGRDLLVETAGFAVLAWLPDGQRTGNVRRAIEYLQSSRNGRGTFGATQATIVALRAITAYATANRTMRADGTLRVFEGDKLLREHAFAASDTDAIEFDLWRDLAPGEHTLRLEVEGGGESTLPWSGEVAYHAETPADDPSTATAITTSLRQQIVAEGQTVALDVVVSNTTDDELPTPMAIIGLPAGLELPTEVLEDMQKAERFAYWELSGRELVLYWRKFDGNARHELTFDLVAKIPGTTSGPASRTYLYYTPAQKRWSPPLQVEVTAR